MVVYVITSRANLQIVSATVNDYEAFSMIHKSPDLYKLTVFLDGELVAGDDCLMED